IPLLINKLFPVAKPGGWGLRDNRPLFSSWLAPMIILHQPGLLYTLRMIYHKPSGNVKITGFKS
ncbi:MAG: hypothetical protein OEZ28_11465, partial [Nitrospinota bacterium]|nr:hypothetical protein [Nitrospinota bacterium]